MENVQAECCTYKHGAVKDVEVPFRGDDVAGPSVSELDNTVHRSNVDQDRAGGDTDQHHFHVLVKIVVAGRGEVVGTLEWFVVEVTDHEFNRQSHIESDSDHLENDTAQHDVASQVGAGVRIIAGGGSGSKATSDTLNAQSDKISTAEYDGVHPGLQSAVARAKTTDDLGQNDEVRSNKECWGLSGCDCLDEEGGQVMWAVVRPQTRTPSDNFGICSNNCCGKEVPHAVVDSLSQVDESRDGEKRQHHHTDKKGRNIFIVRRNLIHGKRRACRTHFVSRDRKSVV